MPKLLPMWLQSDSWCISNAPRFWLQSHWQYINSKFLPSRWLCGYGKWASSCKNLPLGCATRLNAAYLATETSYNIEIMHVTCLGIILSKEQIKKALNQLHRWAGWSVPVLFRMQQSLVFSHQCPSNVLQYILKHIFII